MQITDVDVLNVYLHVLRCGTLQPPSFQQLTTQGIRRVVNAEKKKQGYKSLLAKVIDLALIGQREVCPRIASAIEELLAYIASQTATIDEDIAQLRAEGKLSRRTLAGSLSTAYTRELLLRHGLEELVEKVDPREPAKQKKTFVKDGTLRLLLHQQGQ